MRFLERLNSPIALVVAVTVFLVLDGLLLYRYQQSLRSTEESAPNAPLEETTSSLGAEPTTAKESTSPLGMESTTAGKTSSSPEEEKAVRVAIEVGSAAVGLSIREDGKSVYNQVASPGFSTAYHGEKSVTVSAADGGGVQVERNDDGFEPLGPSGKATTRTFTADDEG